MKLRYAWVLLAWLLLAAPAHAQPVDSGSIVANSSGGGCTVTPPACVVITFSNQLITTIVLQVSGTYTGTLAFEATSSANPMATSAVWFSITGTNLADVSTATGTTSTGQFSFPNSGLMGIRARATAWTSGTASISAVRGYAVARGGSSPFGVPIPALASGGCTTPSYTFTGDTDSGIGWLGANNIAGCAGGATIFDWSPTVFSIYKSALATTSTTGALLVNSTAATGAATVQISPAFKWRGTAWDTAASQTVDFFAEVLPATAAAPTGTWKLGYSLNGAAATYPLTVSSAGLVIVGGLTTTTSGVTVPNSSSVNFGTQGYIGNSADGKFYFEVTAGTGFGVDATTAGTMKVRNTAQNAYAIVDAGGLSNSGVVTISATAPTTPVACTSPTVTWSNGTATFQIDVGTSCTGVSTLAFTMPAATNGWQCVAHSVSAPATSVPSQSAGTTTSVTLTNYARTTGLAADWADEADIRVQCSGG